MNKKDFYVMPNYYEARVDLNKWIPDEGRDSEKILKNLYEYYEAMKDICGGEEEEEALALYLKVKTDGIIKCKQLIQDFYYDSYWVVGGEIEEYYQYDKETIEMIKLTILKEDEE